MLEAVRVEASLGSPEEVLAAVETITLHAGNNAWHLLLHPWPWSRRAIGILHEPTRGDYVRRASGGPAFPAGGDTVYAALVGPRRPGTPIPLRAVYRLLEDLVGECSRDGPLRYDCWGGTVAAAAGKLAQRPVVELAGPRDAVLRAVRRGVSLVGAEPLPRELVRRESVERLGSPEWNWGFPGEPSHRAEARTSEGFTLGAAARLEGPLIAWLRLYGDILVYPPAQALLLVDQLQGIPPALPAVLEFINGWATLVETVGASIGEVEALLRGLFEEMMRDAGL